MQPAETPRRSRIGEQESRARGLHGECLAVSIAAVLAAEPCNSRALRKTRPKERVDSNEQRELRLPAGRLPPYTGRVARGKLSLVGRIFPGGEVHARSAHRSCLCCHGYLPGGSGLDLDPEKQRGQLDAQGPPLAGGGHSVPEGRGPALPECGQRLPILPWWEVIRRRLPRQQGGERTGDFQPDTSRVA